MTKTYKYHRLLVYVPFIIVLVLFHLPAPAQISLLVLLEVVLALIPGGWMRTCDCGYIQNDHLCGDDHDARNIFEHDRMSDEEWTEFLVDDYSRMTDDELDEHVEAIGRVQDARLEYE